MAKIRNLIIALALATAVGCASMPKERYKANTKISQTEQSDSATRDIGNCVLAVLKSPFILVNEVSEKKLIGIPIFPGIERVTIGKEEPVKFISPLGLGETYHDLTEGYPYSSTGY